VITLLLTVLTGAPSVASAADPRSAPFPRLVTAEWVRSERNRLDLVVLHVDRTRLAYDSAHAEGARFVATAEFTVTRNGILTEVPPGGDLVALLERLGISDRTAVVVYGDLLSAARLFMTLDYLGHERMALLDGGLAAWRDAGFPVEQASPSPPAPARYSAKLRPGTIVTTAWVRDHLADSAIKLLDARSPTEYSGEQVEDGVSRSGHLPGAALLDWHTLVDGARFKPADQLRALVQRAGLTESQTAVTYCRVGTRASLLYFVLRYLDRPVRLYDGSLNEWSSKPELPVVRGDHPAGSEGGS
jgi:thiosulfate/3-mercaptopyruvate sulfurtransferase